MSIINEIRRKKINLENKEQLQNNNFTVISSNCNGSIMSHDLNQKFCSPFVNLWMYPNHFIKYLTYIEKYMLLELSFIKKEAINFPVGLLGDIEIYFQHYDSEVEAAEKWNERTKRINLENIFVMMTDRDGCTLDNLKEFDKLPYKNKVVFTNRKYPEIESSFYIAGYDDFESVGECFEFCNFISGKRVYDQFPFIEWFNGNFKVYQKNVNN